jgi:hypothetical protein
MARRFISVLIAAALFSPLADAQLRGGFHGSGRGGHGFGTPFGVHHRDGFARGYFAGDTAFFYDDYPFAPAMPEPSQFVVTQSPSAVEERPIRTASLLIELQGNRYVRYGGMARSGEADGSVREVAGPRASSGVSPVRVASADLSPTVLVYRDGHREEVADYAIVGRVMYAHSSGGVSESDVSYGMKNIQLSALDIPATMRANRENGLNFALPSAPNEVVTRP